MIIKKQRTTASNYLFPGLLVFLFLSFLSVVATVSFADANLLQNKLSKIKQIQGSYSFIVLGDNRSGDRIYNNLLKKALLRKPVFIVNTGDLITHPGDLEQWKNFRKLSSIIDIPYLLVVGNHDVDDEKSEKIWKQEVDLPGNELYYSWVVGNSLFVVLDGYEPKHDLKIESTQLEWLKLTLNPKKYKRQFVFIHPPLYLTKGSHHYGQSIDRYPKLRDELQKLFVQKKVDIVFAGHEHAYQKHKVDDIWHITTGGGGARIYDSSFCHFVLVNVNADRIEITVIDKEGAIRDEFFIH